MSTINTPLGTEWVIDATGCDASALSSLQQLQEVFARVINDLDLRVVGDVVWHQFAAPFGVTGLALLTESHLACHTYPEHQSATFNLYCCRERTSWPWELMLKEMLGATDVNVRVLDRAISVPGATATGRDAEHQYIEAVTTATRADSEQRDAEAIPVATAPGSDWRSAR